MTLRRFTRAQQHVAVLDQIILILGSGNTIRYREDYRKLFRTRITFANLVASMSEVTPATRPAHRPKAGYGYILASLNCVMSHRDGRGICVQQQKPTATTSDPTDLYCTVFQHQTGSRTHTHAHERARIHTPSPFITAKRMYHLFSACQVSAAIGFLLIS